MKRDLYTADAAFAWAVAYTQQRHAFGKRIADFQNTQFTLAEVSTELDVTAPTLTVAF